MLYTNIHSAINHPTHGTSKDKNIIFDIPVFCSLVSLNCQMTQAMLEKVYKGIGNREVKGINQVNEVGTIVTRLKCTSIHVEMTHDPTLVPLVTGKFSIEVPNTTNLSLVKTCFKQANNRL